MRQVERRSPRSRTAQYFGSRSWPQTRKVAATAVRYPACEQLVDTLDICIKTLTAAHLEETAMLLRIAKLDLVVRSNGITEDELVSLLAILRRPE